LQKNGTDSTCISEKLSYSPFSNDFDFARTNVWLRKLEAIRRLDGRIRDRLNAMKRFVVPLYRATIPGRGVRHPRDGSQSAAHGPDIAS
jgi:hypothetical protein